MLMLLSADLFSKLMFSNNYFGNSMRVKQFQTVCKGHQETTKVAANKKLTFSVQWIIPSRLILKFISYILYLIRSHRLAVSSLRA